MQTLRDAAFSYHALGYRILKLQPRTKKAYGKGWSDAAYEDPCTHWDEAPTDNIGMPLGRNHLFVIDIDNLGEYTKSMAAIEDMLVEHTGVDTMFWETDTIGITSGREGSEKYLFSLPSGLDQYMKYHSIDWRNREGKSHSVVEFRCGDGFQDVMPPSIHPSGTTYQFTHADSITPIPIDLYYLVHHWDLFAEKLQQVNPDYVKPLEVRSSTGKPYVGDDYAQMWCDKEYLPSWLSKYGYQHVFGNRYLSPHSTSGSPGIVLFEDMKKFWSFGASDPFCDGRPHSAYDLLVHYEYNGSYREAWKYILEDLKVKKSRNFRRDAVWKKKPIS